MKRKTTPTIDEMREKTLPILARYGAKRKEASPKPTVLG